MTTTNIPDLPHVVAFSTGGSNSPLKVGSVDGGSVRIDVGTGNWYDPADLISELSRFVPIPAEARKVGPGEPAASEGEPVAWAGATGEVFRDATNPGRMYGTGAERAMPRAEVEQYHGPLTALYAHPPVTEPATAPSVEGTPEETAPDRLTGSEQSQLRSWGRIAGHPVFAPCIDRSRDLSLLDAMMQRLDDLGHPATAPSVTDASVGNSDATVSAPSVEQIAEVHTYHGYNGHYDGTRVECLGCNWSEDVRPGTPLADVHARHVAEEIRALWSPAPGDAAEEETWTDADGVPRDFVALQGAYGEEKAARLAAEAKVRGLKRRSEGAEEREEAQRTRANEEAQRAEKAERLLVKSDYIINEKQAENERLRAALEAAETRVVRYMAAMGIAEDARAAATTLVGKTENLHLAIAAERHARRQANETHRDLNAARAAVEASTPPAEDTP